MHETHLKDQFLLPETRDNQSKMDDKVVIDCIGPSVLTIAISGAAHSVSIATDVIRISGPGGVVDQSLDSLPLIYDAAALGGRLNICDGTGKMVYCWRSSVMLQSRPSASIQERADRSSSSSLEPVPGTDITRSDSSLVAVSSNQPGDLCSTSVRTGDTSRISTESSTATLTPSGNFTQDTTDSRDSTSDGTLEEVPQKSEGPSNENLVVRVGRHLRELKRKREWGKLREQTLCQECRDEADDPVVVNCYHVFCKECLMPLAYEVVEQDEDEMACPKCKDTITDIQSCESLKELWLDTFLKVDRGLDRKTRREAGEGYMNLEDEDAGEPASGFTEAQKRFLVYSINKLLKLSYGEFFRKPANYLSPTSTPMDLRTMRCKLHDHLYPSVEAIKADFDQMEHSSVIENGPHHERSEQARSLRAAFETYMTEYPGQGEHFAPRKKAKMREPKVPAAQTAARAGASSRPRAVKTAMQGQK